ncbi:MAG: response regulator transcription factor [Elusimicrobia bacterium]|nr:response regulator transcription factor [Elusimicrobiota bacterium]MDE2512400.1 response regulator transcription factor [Elusimicrobiota bacterium]
MPEKKKILVVDDEEEYRVLMCRVLAAAGYEVRSAANGRDGLKLYAESVPDLVMLDVMLPDMLGFDFCRTIRAGAEAPETPVLFCSVRFAVSSLARGIREGSTDYVIKPFVPEDLLARVRAALAGKKA